jgi:MFS family permease
VTDLMTGAVARRTERRLLAATFITWLGNSIHLTAAALLLLRTENTSAAVGWLMIAVAVPQALLSIVFGRMSDRFDRRTLCVLCDLLSCLAALALPVALSLGVAPTTAAYTTTFLLISVSAMYLPAISGLIKERVPGADLPRFNANFEMALQAGTLLSTAIGGFAVQLVGTSPAFVFNAATYLASAALMFTIGRRVVAPAMPAVPADQSTSPTPETPARPAPVARISILYALGSGFLTVTNTLIVVLVVQTFGQGAGVLGVVDSLAGVGVLAAAVAYKRASRRFDQLSIAVFGYLCCAVLVFLYPRWGVVALIFLYTAGSACFGIARIAARTMLLDAVGEHNVGRAVGAARAYGLVFSVAVTVAITQATDSAGIATGYLMFAIVIVAVTVVAAALLRSAGYRPSVVRGEGSQ